MIKEHNDLLQRYLNEEISLSNYLREFESLHSKRLLQKTEYLIDNLDTRLKDLFLSIRQKIEELTDLRFAGIFDSFKGKADIQNYYICFRHSYIYNLSINIHLGSCGSGTKSGKEYWFVSDPDNIKLIINEPSCGYVSEVSNIMDKDIEFKILSKFIYNLYENEAFDYFKSNYDILPNTEIKEYCSEYDKFYF